MQQSPYWEANSSLASQEIPAFCGTRSFISRYLSLFWASSIQYKLPSHFNLLRCILVLSSHLRSDIFSGPFPSDFPTKILYTPLLCPIRATCLAYNILLISITRIIFGEKFKLWNSQPARPRPTALLSPRSNGKTRCCYCSCWAPDDGREDARNMLSCT